MTERSRISYNYAAGKLTGRRVKTGFLGKLSRYKVLLLMLLPAVVYYFIFSYIPMGGALVAFKSYDYAKGIFGSPWVGLENFRFFFQSGKLVNVTVNTILYNLAFLTVNTTLQITVAIMLSEVGGKYFKKIAQSVMFLPYFVSWVVVGAIVYNIFNVKLGLLNNILGFFGLLETDVYRTPGVWKYILVFFSAWKNIGYGSVVYLAAIMGIDTEMYEAAEIDGANIFTRIRKITLPCMTPTIITLVLLAIGSIFRGDFSMFYQIVGDNGLLFDSTDVIDTFTFRSLMKTQEIGMSAAVGLYQSILCFTILMVTNAVIRKVDSSSALF